MSAQDHWATVFPSVKVVTGNRCKYSTVNLFGFVDCLRWTQPLSSLVVNSRCCQIYLVSWGGGGRCSKVWRVDSVLKLFLFYCNPCFFKTLKVKKERTKVNSSSTIHRMPFQHQWNHTHTHTPAYTHTHTQCLTVCEPWRQEHFGAGPCGRRTRPPVWVILLHCAVRPPSPQLWIYAQKRVALHAQICAFGSEHNYVSTPSKREGKMHTRTQTHTFLHTHSRSPSFYKNRENIRCCLFSMFYCWAMLGRSFVQSTKYTYNSCILFFYNFQRDVVDPAHCKRQLQQMFICK